MKSEPATRILFGAAVFLAAFLLFQMQPLLGKALLPWFGGAPAVWITCLVFFQTMLFLGALYAHGLSRLRFRRQLVAHLALAVLAAATLPLRPGGGLQPTDLAHPAGRLLWILMLTAGPPFLVLAGSGPLLQNWLARATGGAPYRFYALSNLASLAALLGYPLLVEPRLDLPGQDLLWSVAFGLTVLLAAACAWRVRGAEIAPGSEAPADRSSGPKRRSWLPAAWTLAGVILLMAVTDHLGRNLAALPLLWVLPLAIYLVSWILAFAGGRLSPRPVLVPATLVATIFLELVHSGRWLAFSEVWLDLGLAAQIAWLLTALLILCWTIHAEVYRLRPRPARLTRFYLAISGGGAAGGLLAGAVAPAVFSHYQELPLGLALTTLLLLAGRRWRRPMLAGLSVIWLAATVLAFLPTRSHLDDVIFAERTFFGLNRVRSPVPDKNGRAHLVFLNGTTIHGVQLTGDPGRSTPAGYYSPVTGIGLVFETLLRNRADGQNLEIGVLGMGVGTLASYGGPGDRIRFWEIDPAVAELARRPLDPASPDGNAPRFHYLADSSADCEVVLGDARLELARELETNPDRRYDLLVLDVFSSDAIPAHLITTEAFDLYRRALKPGGVLAVHVSNRWLDLRPLCYGNAARLGMETLFVANLPDDPPTTLAADWAVMCGRRAFLEELVEVVEPLRKSGVLRAEVGDPTRWADLPLWTDDRSDLFGLLKSRTFGRGRERQR